VSLTVYSLDGRLVAALVDEAMPEGQHEAVWMGRDDSERRVAAGTYLYRLQAGEFSETKRMMLLK
jgi:flagellar hook assembly protein FlgD